MKICFLHYYFKKDGVTRTVLNNVRGLREQSPDIEFVFVGNPFNEAIPDYAEKRIINWEAEDLVSEIEKVSSDSDVLIIENPVVGIYPRATLAFKEFAEKNLSKKIIYRIHDFIDDRPHLSEEFRKFFKDINDVYPKSDNVHFLTLTSFDKGRLLQKGLKNVSVIPNSIVESNLYTSEENAKKLREKFEESGIVKPGEKIISYPVRVLRRKNIEEAILITKLLNNFGGNHRLIITVPHEDDYAEEIKSLAKKHDVPCSIGEAYKFLDYGKGEFTTADLFAISDLVISTSIKEGFGFAFIEPWVSGTPLIGRNIPEITKDFEEAGIDLSALYDNSVLHNSKNPEERMSKVKTFLSDNEKMDQLQTLLGLNKRIEKSSSLIEKNKEAVLNNYNHIHVAGKLLNQIDFMLRN